MHRLIPGALAAALLAPSAWAQDTTPTTVTAAQTTTIVTTLPGDPVPGDNEPATTTEGSSAKPKPKPTPTVTPAGGGSAPVTASSSPPAQPRQLPGGLASTGSEPLVPIGIGLTLLALSGLVFVRQQRVSRR